MGFKEVLEKSWKEYRANFKEIFKFLFLILGVPSLVIYIITFIWSFSFLESLQNSLIGSADFDNFRDFLLLISQNLPYFIFLILSSIIYYALYIFAESSMFGISVKKNNYKNKDLINSGKNSFWNFIGFSIVFFVFLGLLFLALIIPGIIFLVFWIFGYYVLFDEKKGFIYSLKKSFYLVRGRWWKTFGYALLMLIILVIAGFFISLIGLPTRIYINSAESLLGVPTFILAAHSILQFIAGFLEVLITVPLGIIFFKNMYFEWKRK